MDSNNLQRRVLAKYLQQKTAAGPLPLGNDEPGLPGMEVEAASAMPGGNDGGPGKRNIPKNHPYDPRALKPLSRMLWAMSVSLGHALTAYRQFARLKSATISPDGMLGGRGYVMQIKEIRSRLHDACESLSAISDTIHDEVNAPHWEPKMNELDPNDALDVRKFLDESKQILQDPEAEAEEDMDAIEDAATDAATGEETPDVEAEPAEESVPLDESEATPEDAALAEGEEAPEEGFGEEETEGLPEEGVPTEEGDEEAVEEEEEFSTEEAPEGEEVPEDESAVEFGDEEAPVEEGEEETEEAPVEEETEEAPVEEETEEAPVEEETEEAPEAPVEEEDTEEEEPVQFDEEDEALVDQAWESSAMPGAEEPKPEPLGKPKKLKKKKRIKINPEMAQEQKFAPEMHARMASYSYSREANSSVSPDSLPGPRVEHLGPAQGQGPFDSFNEDEPAVTDNWGESGGRSESDDYIYQTPWENDTREAVSRPSISIADYRTLAGLIDKGWDEDRILKSAMAKRLQIDANDIEDARVMKAKNLLAYSDMPTDNDTPTDAWDFGIGYGAEGQGAGGYGNPSGEGSGSKGVYGPTSGLPTEHSVKNDETTPSVDVEVNERTNVHSQTTMPTDVEPPVARSDYYTEGLTDEMIATSELPADPVNPYNYDRDLPNRSEMHEHHDTPYIRYDYTTHNYRPDPNYSRPER